MSQGNRVDDEAAEIVLAYAAVRWPNANRVTMPALCASIAETKRELDRSKQRDDKPITGRPSGTQATLGCGAGSFRKLPTCRE